MTEPEPTEFVHTFLNSVCPGETRMATVTGFEGYEVIVDLDGANGPYRALGRILRHELSWRRAESPAEIVTIGKVIEVEVIGVDWNVSCCRPRHARTSYFAPSSSASGEVRS